MFSTDEREVNGGPPAMPRRGLRLWWFIYTAIAVGVLALGAVTTAAQPVTAARPDLAGHWQLNRELSDDARVKLKAINGRSGDTLGGHGPGRHGGLGRIFGGLFGGGRAAHAQIEDVIVNAPTSFILVHDDQRVVLTDQSGRARTLPTNNRKTKVDGRDVRTRWETGRLVSEITVGAAKVVETYERSATAPQLIVTAMIEMQGQKLAVRRVYDPVTK